MKRFALFVFNGDPVCFVHVLLNALDMKARGYDGRMVIEGAATRLVPELAEKTNALNGLWRQALDAGCVDGVCRACAGKMGTLDAALEQGLAALDDMNGHPGMAAYRDRGYEIFTF